MGQVEYAGYPWIKARHTLLLFLHAPSAPGSSTPTINSHSLLLQYVEILRMSEYL